jgi:hypothetical protein
MQNCLTLRDCFKAGADFYTPAADRRKSRGASKLSGGASKVYGKQPVIVIAFSIFVPYKKSIGSMVHNWQKSMVL